MTIHLQAQEIHYDWNLQSRMSLWGDIMGDNAGAGTAGLWQTRRGS